MKNRLLLCLGALAMVAVIACEDSTDPTVNTKTVTLTATMTPAAEVPAPTGNITNSAGTVSGVLDTSTNIFTYDVVFSGLSSNVTLGHIHGPADVGATASPILTFSNNTNGQQFTTGATSGTAHGTWLLTDATSFSGTAIKGDSLRKLMLAGKTYVNIHTSTNGPGEIRGQITIKQP